MKAVLVIGFLLLVVLAVIFVPFLTVWSLNTLFSLTIPYTFKTWLATICLMAIIRGASTSTKKDD